MSERGSFVTEYVHCLRCFNRLRNVLKGEDKYLCVQQISHYDKDSLVGLPILAGKIGGLYSGEEVDTFDIDFRDEIEALICHDLRIAVLSDNVDRQKILVFHPKNSPPEEKVSENL